MTAVAQKNDFSLAGWVVRPSLNHISREGSTVPVTPKAMDLLQFLAIHRGEVLSKEEILSEVWRGTFVTDDALKQCVLELRKAFGDDAKQPRILQTVHRRGYRLIDPKEDPNSAGRSIAVLPLGNASGDPDLEYLADGITETIINMLSQIRSLRVLPRSTVFRFKEKDRDAALLGRELGVTAVATGRVSVRGEDLTIASELIDVEKQAQVWGDRFSRKRSDLMPLQREIASEITAQLCLKLTPEERRNLGAEKTRNSAAYEHYLKGRYYWNKRTEDGLNRAIHFFGQAIQLDPHFAAGHAGLADAWVLLGWYGLRAPADAFPQALAAAHRAVELDGDSAEAHTSLGYSKSLWEWSDSAGAERHFVRAIELNPSYAIAHHWYADFLQARGRARDAVGQSLAARRFEPLSLIINAEVGRAYYYARDYDAALEQHRATLELEPNFPPGHFFLGQVLVQTGAYEDAARAFETATRLAPEVAVYIAGLAHARALAGDEATTAELRGKLAMLSSSRYVSPFLFAMIELASGDAESALALLKKAAEERSHWLLYLQVDPALDSLRSDPRFTALQQRIFAT